LQVVNDDQAKFAAALPRQPARIGAQRGHRQARRFVDMQRHVAQLFDRLRQARPLVVGKLAGAQVHLVDTADRADDTHGQLARAHFHREHCHRQLFVQRDVLGNVDRKSRLTHAGPRREHDHVTRLEAGREPVQVVEAGRHARDVVRVVGHLLHSVQQLDHQGIHGLETLLHARAFLADVEDLLLGFVEDLVDRFAQRVECGGSDFVAGAHQLAQDGALAHDLGVAADVARAGHVLRQRIQVGKAPDLVRLAQPLQLFVHRDHVGRLGGVDQATHGRVDQPVLIAVEVAVSEQIPNPVPGVVVQQEPAQHAGFRFDRVRRNAQLRDLVVAGKVVVNGA